MQVLQHFVSLKDPQCTLYDVGINYAALRDDSEVFIVWGKLYRRVADVLGRSLEVDHLDVVANRKCSRSSTRGSSVRIVWRKTRSSIRNLRKHRERYDKQQHDKNAAR